MIDSGINAGNISASHLAAECDGLAALLDGRAMICDEYWSDVRQWRSSHWDWVSNNPEADGVREPRRPQKPTRWID